MTFQAPDDGTYVVRLFAFPSVPDASVRFAGGERFIYRLTLTTGAFVTMKPFGSMITPEPSFCCTPIITPVLPGFDSTGPYPVANTWTTLGVIWLTSFLTAVLN